MQFAKWTFKNLGAGRAARANPELAGQWEAGPGVGYMATNIRPPSLRSVISNDAQQAVGWPPSLSRHGVVGCPRGCPRQVDEAVPHIGRFVEENPELATIGTPMRSAYLCMDRLGRIHGTAQSP
jgi:hypothetical protein